MTGTTFHPLIASNKDGLLSLKFDPWILRPIKSLGKYLEVYSYKLPSTYNHLIYLDLNPGPGMLDVSEMKGLVYDTPLIALSSPVNFSRYIFWEPNETYAQALRIRINRDFKAKNTLILNGTLENMLAHLNNYIPLSTKGIRPWVFCNIHPRFGEPSKDTLSALMKYGFTVFLSLCPPKEIKEGWLSLSKPSGTSPEYGLRSTVKEIELWTIENQFALSGSFYRIEDSKSFSLIYSGLLSQNRTDSKIIKEVEKNSVSQMQLFS